MPPKPLPNKVHYTNTTPETPADYTIFFIPGNPGIIEFYALFLKTLHRRVSQQLSTTRINVDVIGITLRGFECGDDGGKDDIRNAPEFKNLPLDIDGQLSFLEATLDDVRARNPRTKVILAGHSLGSFLTMELLQLHRRRSQHNAKNSTPDVVGAMAVFPALTHLARSKSGKVVNRLAGIPGFVVTVAMVLWVLGWLLPIGVLRRSVEWMFGYPGDAAETVARWWGSRWGVWESVHLGREEMVRIAEDRWDDETWGSGVHLLVGEKDDWVPDREWEDLLLKRTRSRHGKGDIANTETDHATAGSRGGVDVQVKNIGGGTPHDFTIRHAIHTAEVASTSVYEIISRCET